MRPCVAFPILVLYFRSCSHYVPIAFLFHLLRALSFFYFPSHPLTSSSISFIPFAFCFIYFIRLQLHASFTSHFICFIYFHFPLHPFPVHLFPTLSTSHFIRFPLHLFISLLTLSAFIFIHFPFYWLHHLPTSGFLMIVTKFHCWFNYAKTYNRLLWFFLYIYYVTFDRAKYIIC